MNMYYLREQLALCALALLVSLCLLAQVASGITTTSLMPEMSAKELRTNFKIFLTKMKIRQVPLAKERSERLLAQLYREERAIDAHKKELEGNLNAVSDKSRRHGMKVLEVRRPSEDQENEYDGATENTFQQSLMRVSELTEGKIAEWQEELDSVQREYEEIRAKIDQTKKIIKDPESFIAVPTNYGRDEPEVVQEREREILLIDLINMNYRQDVKDGTKEKPLWLRDVW